MAEQTTRLYMVRHGATQLSAEDRFAGAVNVELSEEGKFQAGRLAERLADDSITAVYCSPLTRTVQTATILASPHHLPLIHRRACAKSIMGTGRACAARTSNSSSRRSTLPGRKIRLRLRRSGWGSRRQCDRAGVAGDPKIVLEHRGQNVIVVSHKATLRLLISSLLGFDARGYRDRLDQSPACLNVLDFKDPVRARLMLFNDVSHYTDHPKRPSSQLSKWWDAGGEERWSLSQRGRYRQYPRRAGSIHRQQKHFALRSDFTFSAEILRVWHRGFEYNRRVNHSLKSFYGTSRSDPAHRFCSA